MFFCRSGRRESAIFKSTKLTKEQKQKWMKVMSNEYMSSEESDNDNCERVIIHPLPWRSEVIDRMFQKIDDHLSANKSSQAKRQTKERTVGVVSNRKCPNGEHVPSWAISNAIRTNDSSQGFPALLYVLLPDHKVNKKFRKFEVYIGIA